MIQTLSIRRFKSIRSLVMECARVNVLIGAPDTGKTNILEALSFLSRLGWGLPIDCSLRLSKDLGFGALFYRQFFDKPFELVLETPNSLYVRASLVGPYRRLQLESNHQGIDGILEFGLPRQLPQLDWIRHYAYSSSSAWAYKAEGRLGQDLVTPPEGENLLYIARHHQRVYQYLKELLLGHNWRLHPMDGQQTLRLSEVREDEIIDYNLDLLSDSLKRLFFYGAILRTTREATLVFDEPDVFAFPPYPKALGEMIAADTNNQVFLTTHNPYLLAALAEKTTAAELALFVCSRDEEGATVAKRVPADRVSQVIELGSSVFFNLSDLVAP